MEQFERINSEDLTAYLKSKGMPRKKSNENEIPRNTPKEAIERYSLTRDGIKEKGIKIDTYDDNF